jgi:hypothetical protein
MFGLISIRCLCSQHSRRPHQRLIDASVSAAAFRESRALCKNDSRMHPFNQRMFAEDLVRIRRPDERERYATAQRQARIDPNPHQN